MAEVRDFLVELGAEELPPTALKRLADAFAEGIRTGLEKADIPFAEVKAMASPRRLAVLVKDLAVAQPDREIQRKGPALQAAYDADGNPTKAAEGFARSCGAEFSQLEKLETDKGSWLIFNTIEKGTETAQLLPELINKSVNQLPVPKRMRWGSSRIEFSRPVHWLVMLFGSEVIDCEVLGLKSGRSTMGHRYHHNQAIELASTADYVPALEKAFVLVDMAQRREAIRAQVLAEAEKLSATAVIDEDLLDEVNGLVEWPVALTGTFEERFLEVPSECLISSMKANQKYFHLLDANGKLKPNFITICNIISQDPAQVIAGNEKVIRPRLADAAFFFTTDKKKTLADRIDSLKTVLFQQQLGSVYAKSQRVSAIAQYIAEQIGGDQALAARAADLSKCDLVSEMVLEFPELQGIMGYHYALNDGENAEVAQALNEQYMPRFAGDELPATKTGMALALADRIDTLTGIFGIGQRPTGDKDPFALRRATIGALSILVNNQLDLDLKALIALSIAQHGELPKADGLADDVLNYMLDRFRAWYQTEGIPAEIFLAVRARPISNAYDFDRRVKAVAAFKQLPEADALAAANKRVNNILSKQNYQGGNSVNEALLSIEAEKTLAAQVAAKQVELAPLFAAADYQAALNSLASLRGAVDSFFDDVMVMADDEQVKNNRLALLASLSSLFMEVADIAQLQQ
ncbi:glycyl-tRNA synthetase beta chain [Oceanospirillum multiglobuliferum]|uniref:Glycine--tRNA ligase beta subunit n=1 Tax=Oceanospirillum multiglobuliferum TaxID=64969 RepID=A0A1T4NRA7_9GAMM|nr:glycine--tRNA ligase subunit beta [Oceanospirillum multiglobuliferum]OPX55701.1 glycine--tRNA ligase subunit beta [Oceanospirillum multiglobuliferum]SJZ81732.1 glycyl-tRNA synthetase beta chain [Oceanospirillum multiglobuliferum]